MDPQHDGDEHWAAIARIVGPRGNRGELQAVPLSDLPGRYQKTGEVYLLKTVPPDAGHHRFVVDEAWEHKGRIVFKFRGIDTISEAERWRDCEVRVPISSRPSLPEGEYYQSDLAGCEVLERATGNRLGRVGEWLEQGGAPLMRVEGVDGREMLIPFAKSICVEIDPAGRRIVVELPEGLKDLNG